MSDKNKPKPTVKEKDQPGEPSQTTATPISEQGGGGCCSWHLLAFLPIVIAFLVYNIPTLRDEYDARFG